MSQVIETVEVGVPIREAYDQWTQFERFPEFLSYVDRITQQDATHTHWTVTVAGTTREFDAEVTEQHPDERVAWKSTTGDVDHAGVVTFHRISDDRTRVTVQLGWEERGVVERVGALLGFDDRAVKRDLEHFKEFVESRGAATGAWRGEVQRH